MEVVVLFFDQSLREENVDGNSREENENISNDVSIPSKVRTCCMGETNVSTTSKDSLSTSETNLPEEVAFESPTAFDLISTVNIDMKHIDDGMTPLDPALKPKSIEEQYMVVLHRGQRHQSRSTNSRYRCKYCALEFMGGPQKIRVHLSGKHENATRMSKCQQVPEEIRSLMLSRMKPLVEGTGKYEQFDLTLSDSSASNHKSSLDSNNETNLHPARNAEEKHVTVINRSNPGKSRYRCKYCALEFTGGPQKIRVHLTGQVEASTKASRCPQAPDAVQAEMQLIRPRARLTRKRAFDLIESFDSDISRSKDMKCAQEEGFDFCLDEDDFFKIFFV